MKFFKALGKFFALIISILVGIISILMISYLSINKFLKIKNIKNIINTQNILNIEYEETTIKEETIKIFEEFDITYNDSKNIVEGEEFINLLDDYLNKIINYYFQDNKFPEIDTNKLNTVLELALSKNSNLTNEHKKTVKENLIKQKIELEQSLPTKNKLLEDEFIENTINIYNNISILYFVGTIMILMFIIFILTYSLHKPFQYIGVTLITSSIITLIIYLFKNKINTYINQSLHFITNNIFHQLLLSSLTILLIGIILLLIYILINKSIKKEVK